MTDLLVRDGWVVDGSGRAPFRGDVAITDGRIEHVGAVNGHRADRVIEAAGRIVCPGFVDPHSHSDWSLLANPRAESTIRQGVTTEVVGNCGWTYAPVSEAAAHFVEGRMRTVAYDGPGHGFRIDEGAGGRAHERFLRDGAYVTIESVAS